MARVARTAAKDESKRAEDSRRDLTRAQSIVREAPDPERSAQLSRSFGLVELAFPEEWRDKVRKSAYGLAVLDFAGRLGVEGGPGFSHTHPHQDRRANAADSARRLATILEQGETRGFREDQIDRAVHAIETAIVAYFRLDGKDALSRRAGYIATSLESLSDVPDAAKTAHADWAFDRDGLGRISVPNWQDAFNRWPGLRTSDRRRSGATASDWRDVVLDLLDVASPTDRNRPDARRWLNKIVRKRANQTE
jgi:hypothetical protein